MATICAHFDGKVFVPDEPVDLPPDTKVQFQIPDLPNQERRFVFTTKNGFPVIDVAGGAKKITMEDVKAAEEDDF